MNASDVVTVFLAAAILSGFFEWRLRRMERLLVEHIAQVEKSVLDVSNGLTLREKRGRELAAAAVAAVEVMPEAAHLDERGKLRARLEAFTKLDMRDGRRDWDDSQARLLIEHAIAVRAER